MLPSRWRNAKRGQRLDLAEAGRRYLENRETIGLKRTTLMDYESYLRVHLVPFFAGAALDEIEPGDVEAFISRKREQGRKVKSITNYLGLLGAIFAFAVRRGWCARNPVAMVDKPRDDRDRDIRFLANAELEALLAATPNDPFGSTERVLYLTAAMTGMRRGELLALRWQDVDRQAGLVRVRRNYTRGAFGTPKSRGSSRAVPLAARLDRELQEHFERSRFQGDLDLVFAHPITGKVFDPSKVRKRFQAAARRAELRPVRFHDLRHTFGTRMAAAGAPLRAIQEWMGHSDYRTTSLYAHYAPDLSRGATWVALAFAEDGREEATARQPMRSPTASRPASDTTERPLACGAGFDASVVVSEVVGVVDSVVVSEVGVAASSSPSPQEDGPGQRLAGR